MQIPFIGRRAGKNSDPSDTATLGNATASDAQQADARSSLVIMLTASTLAMIAINSSQGHRFRGTFGFLDQIRSGLDATLVDWLGRPLAVGALFLIGLIGGAALWPWRKGETPIKPKIKAKAVAEAELPQPDGEAASAAREAESPAPVGAEAVPVSAEAEPALGEDAAMSSRLASLRNRARAEEEVVVEEPEVLDEGPFSDDVDPEVPVGEVALDPEPAAAPTAIDTDVAAALRQAIVFRQEFPPEAEPGLSFYGGTPIASPRFIWPTRADGMPLHFLMQVDCGEIPESARLGLLPDSGVLYFFVDLSWEDMEAVSVVLESEPDETWGKVPVPDLLGPAFGEDARYSFAWVNPQGSDGELLPRILPRWPFHPAAIALPEQDRNDDDRLWWRDSDAIHAELARVEGDVADMPPPPARHEDGSMPRPYPEFPHDWRAVAITSIAVMEKVRSHLFTANARRQGHDDDAIEELRGRYCEQADECLAWARSHKPFKALLPEEAGMFWEWLESLEGIGPHDIRHAAALAIEATLSGSPKAARRLGPEALDLVRSRHALAVQGDSGPFAPTPNRMLAPASFVKGGLSDFATTEVLLLELGANDPIGHRYGEGVYQFTIRPDDLRARRFDKVRLTATAY